jgi:Ca2+-binding RTX toxin-like protein
MAYTGTTPNERADNILADTGQFFAVEHKKTSLQLLAGSNKYQINLSFVGDSGRVLDLTLKGVFQIAEGATTLADVLGKVTEFNLTWQGTTVINDVYTQGHDLAFFDTPNNWVYALSLMSGNDSFTGSSTLTNMDAFQGMSGNDTMTGNKGDDYFDGGTGVDTLVFSGAASEYTIDWNAWVANPILNGLAQRGVKVTDKTANRDGVDQALNVEYLKFSDITLAVGDRSPGQSTKLYLGPNGHWYGVVAQNSISIGQAVLDAQGQSLGSSQGYVATVTSSTENAFIKTVLDAELANYSGILLLGGTDRVKENDWRWLDGPEKNTSTSYVNWDPASGEPNHVYGGIKEDYLAINGNGLWVDVPSGNYTNVGGYVIEFGSDLTSTDPNEWVRFVGAGGDDRVYAITRGSNGVLWGSGTTSGAVGGNVSQGQEDYILVQLDASGNIQQTHQNGSLNGGVDESFASAIDASGNVYVTGYSGVFANQAHGGVTDVFISKYTSSGQLDWLKTFGGLWADRGRAMAIGGNGNLYITGASDDSYTGYDSPLDPNSFLAIYSPQGEQIKYQTLGFLSGDTGYAIGAAKDGSVYIGGAASGTVAGASAQGVDGFLAKYTSTGEQVWVKLIGEQHREEIHALTVDASGAIYVAGVTEGSLGGDNLGGYDGFIAKYLPTGESAWVSHFGSNGHDYVAAMAIGSDGLIYVTGNADGVFANQTSLGNGDAYVVAFNASGKQVGVKVFGSSEGESANSIARGPDGYFLVSGATWGSFGGQQNQGIIDGYVTQMKEFGARSVVNPFVQKLIIDPAGVMRSPKFYFDSETVEVYPSGWSDWYTYHPFDSVIETQTKTKIIFVSEWSGYTSPPHNAQHYPVFPVGTNVLVRNVFEFTGDFSSINQADWQLTNEKQVAEWKDGANGTVVRYTLLDREFSWNAVSYFNNKGSAAARAGADEIVGSFGADAINAHEGADSIQGRGGNDTLTGGAGNDTLDGGLGKDVAVYALAASNYVVASVLGGFTVSATSGSEGIDYLKNIETLRFNGQDQKISNLTTFTEMLKPDQMAGITADGVVNAYEILEVMSDRLKFEANKRNLDFSSIQLSPYAAMAWGVASVATNVSEFDVRLTGASGESLHAKLKVTDTSELIQVTLRTATDTLYFNFDNARSHTTLLTNGKLNNFEKNNKSISLASTRDSGNYDLSYVVENNWIYQKNQVAGSYTWTEGPNTANSAYSHGGYSYSFRDKDNSSGASSSTSYSDDKKLTDAFTVQYRFDDANTGFGMGFDLAKVATVADAIDFKNSVYETNSIKVEATSVRLDAQSSSGIDPNYDLTTFIAGSTEATSLSDVEYAATQLFLPLLLQASNTFTIKGSAAAIVNAGLGDDTITGGAGQDTLDGGDGNDVFLSGLGDDSILGGAGDDAAIAFVGQVSGYNIFKTPAVFTASGGFDTAVGGDGVDTVMVGGLASDFVLTRNSQTAYLLTSKLDASETLSFSGFEKISFGRLTFQGEQPQENPWVIDLAELPIGLAPTITGTSGHDSLKGSAASELISGLAGNDSLDGGGGSDTLDGGDGVDSYWINLAQGSGLGKTTIVDSAGTDRLVLSAASSTDPNLDFRILRANQGKDLAIGYFSQTNGALVQGVLLQDQYAFSSAAGFANTINTLIVSGSQVGNMTSTFRLSAFGTHPQAVLGSSWNDMLFGYGGGLTVEGGEGNDVLIASRLDDSSVPQGQIPGDWLLGQLGNDQLSGHDGNDTLIGGMGDDTLEGGQGNDLLHGGPGRDRAHFPGRFSDYAISFELSTRSVKVEDLRSTSFDSFGGLDTIRSVEEFVFQGDPAGSVTKSLTQMFSAAGQNYGVDLNGSADIALIAESWTGPNSAWQNNNDPAGYTRSSVLSIWAAEIGLKDGIQALRLSIKDLSSLQGVSLKALLGWGGNGPNQGQVEVPVGVYSQPQQYQDNGVTLTASTATRVEDGQTWYDLVVSAPSALSNEAMGQVLRNIRLSYADGSQPERDEATLDVKVAISADGQNWVGAQGGQSADFRANFDNSAPLAAVAIYKGSLLSIGFKDINGLPANLPGTENAWAGLPDKAAFDVRIDGRSVVVRSVQHDSDGVLLILGRDLPASGAVITVAYADPAGDTVRNVLQDWQGNDVPSFKLTAVPAPVFDATGLIGSGATLGFGLPEDGRSERDLYITEGAYMGRESVGRVISATAQTAVGEIIGTAWGINPSYRVGAAAGSVESFLWSREKGVATVAQPAGAPLAVGDSLSLVDMVNFNSPYLLLGFEQYVLLSHDASTPPAAAESVLLSQASQSVGLPMWTVGAGHLLGGKALTLSGGPGNDQLSGLGEQVTLSGAAGDDTYTVTIYGTGSRTTISDSAGVADVLDLKAAAGFFFIPEFERVGNDLVSRGIDEPSRASTDTLTVRNAYASDGMPGEGRIETLRFSPEGDTAKSWRFSHSNEGIWTSDLIAGTSGNESLCGFDGDDFIFDAGGDDLVEGGSGNDSIWIGAGNNTLRGGEGSDDYFWNPTVAGSNLLSDSTRGAQGDTLVMALPTFRLDASYSGQDLLLSSSRSGQVFSSLTLIDFRTTSSVRSFKPNLADQGSPSFVYTATVTSGNDWMVGEASAETLSGGDGDDLLMGSGGADLLEGGRGNDQLFGGTSADTLVGGAGDDIYVVNDAGDVVIELASDNTATQEIFSIGHNNDAVVATVSYTLSAGAAVEDMIASGVGLNGDLSDEEINLTGNELAQGMTGNEAANYLRGMGGDDAMVGMGGNDTLDGGDGNDYFLSGLGNDSIIGGPGDDGVLAFGGQAAGSNIFAIPVLVTVTGGFDTAVGGEGTDTIVVGGLEQDFEVVRSSQTQYLIRSKLDTTETLSFSGFEKVSFGLINFGGDMIQVNPKPVDLASYPVSSDPPSRVSYWKNANISVNNTHLDAAVGLIDAISILKMIVGLKVNAGDSPLSPYQSIAADFNRSGAVDLNDAIEVLKHVVGLPSSDPAWSCYDDSKIPQTLSDSQGLAPGAWSAAAKLSDLSAVPAEVKVIGVLTGDVDGSWAPA